MYCLTYLFTKAKEIYKFSLRKECEQINGSGLCSKKNSYFQDTTKNPGTISVMANQYKDNISKQYASNESENFQNRRY